MINFKRVLICFIMLFLLIFPLSLNCLALHGDVNYDEYIGIEDAISALRFATKIEEPSEEQQHIADLDYDGFITTKDVRLIMRGAADIDYVPDHFFSDWETTVEPTCTEEGVSTCYCFYCEKTVEKSIEKTGHSIVPATCTEDSYCSVCDEILSPALGHTENEGYCITCNILLSSPKITFNGYDIAFGKTTTAVKKIFGEPQDKGKDTDAEKPVVVYVYYTDYKNLGIFTFTDGKLTQFYSNSATAKVTQGNTHYGLYCKSTPEKIGDIVLTAYADKKNNGLNYGFCATVGEDYSLKKTTNHTLLAKINFHLTNALRVTNGIKALKYSSDASAVATAHSKDMAKRNYFSHESPEGKHIGARLDDAGIQWASCGENIAAGIYNPYALSNGWYNSDGHRKNILNKKFRYMAIGFAYKESSAYKYYSTQIFYTDEYS